LNVINDLAVFYVDGNLDGVAAMSAKPTDNANEFRIGMTYTDNFDGLIKDVGVWNHTLSPTEVKSLALGVDLGRHSYRPDDVSVAPTVWWKLNETGGDRADSSGNGHTLTDVNTVESGGGFVEGAAADFESTNNEYLTAVDSDDFDLSGGVWSLSVWLNSETVAGNHSFFSHRSGNDDFCRADVRDGAIHFYLVIGGVTRAHVETDAILDAGAWYHVVCRENGDSWRIFVDGRDETTTGGTDTDRLPNYTEVVRIGVEKNLDQIFDGLMSDYALWKGYALTDTEIASLACGLPVQQQGIVSYWPCDEASGDLVDVVGSNTLTEMSDNSIASTNGVVGSGRHVAAVDTERFAITDAVQVGLEPVALTVVGWVNPDSADGELIRKRGAGDEWRLRYEDGSGIVRLSVNIDGVSPSTDPTVACAAGEFNHLAFIYDGANLELYSEGIKGATDSTCSGPFLGNDGEFWVGKYGTGASYDELSFWARPLRSEEIKSLHNHGLNGQPVVEVDTDSDGMLDSWEQQYFGDLSRDGTGDYDGDGLTDREEHDAGTDPTETDTDGDGFSDCIEIINGTNPNDSTSCPAYPYKQWTRIFGSSSEDSQPSPAVDAESRHVYTTGHTMAPFGGESHAGLNDALLVKYTVAGSQEWVRIWGSAVEDSGRDLLVEGSGDLYVVGDTKGQFDGFTNAGKSDVWLSKWDADGTRHWTVSWGSDQNDWAESVRMDDTGGVYVAGYTRGAFGSQTNAGYTDIFLTKLHFGGTQEWSRIWGGGGFDYAKAVALGNGALYVAGSTESAFDGQTNSGGKDICLTKLTLDGQRLWSRIWGSSGTDEGRGAVADSLGNVYVVGWTDGEYDGQTNSGGLDLCMTKFGPNGDRLWSRIWGSSADDGAQGVAFDPEYGLHVVGYASGALDGLLPIGDPDIYMATVSTGGDLVASRLWGSGNGDAAHGVAVDSNHNVYVTGVTWGDFDLQQNSGECDIFFSKWAASPAWTVPQGMSLIPAGEFQMGDSYGEGDGNELPVHTVRVSAVYMDKFEVTKALWDEVYVWATSNGYAFDHAGAGTASNHPVHTVSWYDSAKWCNARSEKEGLSPAYYTDATTSTVYRTGQLGLDSDWVKWDASGYRLPTEAEWEKGSRGGLTGHHYPWDSYGGSYTGHIDGSKANYPSSGDPWDNGTTPVGYYDGNQTPAGVDMANGYGLYDVAGNLCEWCWDRYQSDWYGQAAATNADTAGPSSGSYRVIRDSNWGGSAIGCRCARRVHNHWPNYNSTDVGFRTVRTVPDTDGDGMDDGWENTHFGDLSRDGTRDYDGDGATDKEEHDAGTDPTDAGSTEGLVAYYPFNGNASDESGNGNNPSVTNADLSTDRHGNGNAAYCFDGSSQYIRIPDSSSLSATSAVTFSAWVRHEGGGAWRYAIKKGVYLENGTYVIGVSDSLPRASAWVTLSDDRTFIATSSTALPQDVWSHIAGVYDGSALLTYVDGQLKASMLVTGTLQSTASPLYLGADYGNAGASFNGKIDDVRIYNRALPSNEIWRLHRAESGVVYEEDFEQDPLFDIREDYAPGGPCVYWDQTNGNFHARTFDRTVENVNCGSSPAFSEAVSSNTGFVVDFDFSPVDPQYGQYPGLHCVTSTGGDEEARIDDAAMRMCFRWSDTENKVFRLSGCGATLYSPQIPGADEWYRHQIVYHSDSSTVDWRIYRLSDASLWFESVGVTGACSSFNQVIIGEYAKPPKYGSESTIRVDNIVVRKGSLANDDTDNDGMKDWWEQHHFGDLSRDGTGDYDGDGATDKEEHDAGTDPTDAGSTEGLVAYYPFNGNADDESGNGHTGVVHGVTATTDLYGIPNSAYAFDGSNDYIQIDNGVGLHFDARYDSYSVAFWFNGHGAEGSDRCFIVDRTTTANPATAYQIMNNVDGVNGVVWTPSDGDAAFDSGPWATNFWHHCCLSVSARDISLYVDGYLRDTAYFDGSHSTANSEGVSIGRYAGAFLGDYYHGALDEVRIYNRALPSNEVMRLYGSAAGGLPLVRGETTFGLGEDERALGIDHRNGALYVGGRQYDGSYTEGLALRYDLPLGGPPAWTSLWPQASNHDNFYGMAAGTGGVYVAGDSYSRTTDGVGGKEMKGIAVRLPLAGPVGAGVAGCDWDQQMPPGCVFSYKGSEALFGMTRAVEDGDEVFYGTGFAQTSGSNGGRTYLSKFSADGTHVWTVDDSSEQVGVAYSAGSDVAALNGYVYVAGVNHDAGPAAARLRKYSSHGSLQWLREGPSTGKYFAVTCHDGAIFAVGDTPPWTEADSDYRIDKWNEDGTLAWGRTYDLGGSNEVLYGVIGHGSELYAVGKADHDTAGGTDAVLLRIDPETGDLRASSLYGGSTDEEAHDITTDGTNLYLVGHTSSGGWDVWLLELQPSWPSIDNAEGATGVATNSATLNGTLVSAGTTPTTVTLYWGLTDGGTTKSAWSNSVDFGVVGGGPLVTNVSGLTTHTRYYYRYQAQNAAGESWAPSSETFVTIPNWGAGLLAYYPFDGDAEDKTGNGHHGTLQGPPSWTAAAAPIDGGTAALDFDGTDYVNVPDDGDLSGLSELTVSCWFKADDFEPHAGQKACLVSKDSQGDGDSGNDSFALYLDKATSGEVTVEAHLWGMGGSPAGVLAVPQNLATGVWCHAAMTYDGATIRLLLDGREIGTAAFSGTLNTNASVPVRVGQCSGPATRYFDGTIDEVKIRGAARTTEQIRQEMGGTMPVTYAWRRISTPVTARDGAPAIHDGKLYLAGGITDTNLFWEQCSDRIWEYDPDSGNWTQLAGKLPYAMGPGYSLPQVVDGVLVRSPEQGPTMNGGWGTHSNMVEFDLEAPGSDGIETAAYPAGGSIWGCMLGKTADGRLYSFGGWTGSGHNNVYSYNPATDAIAAVPPTLTRAGHPYGFAVDGSGILHVLGVQGGDVINGFDLSAGSETRVFNTNAIPSGIVGYPVLSWRPGTSDRTYVCAPGVETDVYEYGPQTRGFAGAAVGLPPMGPDATHRHFAVHDPTNDTIYMTEAAWNAASNAYDVWLWIGESVSIAESAGVGARWRMDEGAGPTAYDSSGNGYHGTISGAVWTSVTDWHGENRSALHFDGDDSVEIIDSTTFGLASNVGVSAWFRADALPSGTNRMTVFRKQTAAGLALIELSLTADGIGGAVRTSAMGGDTTFVSSGTKPCTGTWHHAAAVYDGSSLEIYLDGIEVAESAQNGEIVQSSGSCYIGRRRDGSAAGSFIGNIADVRISHQAYSGSEIAAQAGLVAYYPFEDDANDDSGLGHHGTPAGGLSYVAGIAGQAADFDGVDDVVDVATTPALRVGRYTASFWMRSTATGTKNTSILSAYDDTDGFEVFANGVSGSGHLRMHQHTEDAAAGNHGAFSAGILTDGTWHHITAVYDGRASYLYVDGLLDSVYDTYGTAYEPGGAVKWTDPYPAFKIGHSAETRPQHVNSYTNFAGQVDELRLYNRPMSSNTVWHMYAQEAGLVAYYPFNGNANDESGNGNDGTPGDPTATTDRYGNTNAAYHFDGSTLTDYISVNDSASLHLTNATISAWVRPSPLEEATGYVVSKDFSNGGSCFQLVLNQSGLKPFCKVGRWGVGEAEAVADDGLASNEWALLTCTYDGHELRLYVDGKLKKATVSDNMLDTDNSKPLTIGQKNYLAKPPASHDWPFSGAIDDVRIYNRALSSNELYRIYDDEKPGTQLIISGDPGQYDAPTPHGYGTHYLQDGSTITNQVMSPASGPPGTRYICTGWIGEGSVPGSGDTNVVSFAITTNSTLTWNWRTEYYLDTETSGSGTVDVADNWYTNGAQVTITADPGTNYYFGAWAQEVPPGSGTWMEYSTNNPLSLAMVEPYTLMAVFTDDTDGDGMPNWWEDANGLDPDVNDAGDDADADGLSNVEEYRNNTDPQVADSDSDEFNDYVEVINDTSPTNGTSFPTYPYKEWTRMWGSVGSDETYRLVVRDMTNVYVGGHAGAAFDGLTNAGDFDLCLSVFDARGNRMRVSMWGSSEGDAGVGLDVDGSRYAYLSGLTWGSFDGQSYVGGGPDLCVTKQAPSGSNAWSRILGTAGDDIGEDALVDAHGNVYVAGMAGGSLGGQSHAGGTDVCLVKFDAEGSNQWLRLWGTSGDDAGYGIAQDAAGDLFVAGHTTGDLDGQTNSGSQDLFLTKLSNSGTTLWTRVWGSTGLDYGYDVALDLDGNAYVCGRAAGDFGGQTNAGDRDLCLTKVSGDGDMVWHCIWGSTGYDGANRVTVDDVGNVYVVGLSSGSFDGQTALGGYDLCVSKFNAAGDRAWTRVWGSTDYDHGWCIGAAGGSVYVGGFTKGEFDLQTNVNIGVRDFCLTKWVDTPLFELVVSGEPAPHGLSSPYGYGTNAALDGATVTNTVNTPADSSNGVRYACTGWTGTGSVPASGETNTVSFTITNDSTLTWQWVAEYRGEWQVASGGGSIDQVSAWYTNGASVSIDPTPDSGHRFAGWSGDIGGADRYADPLNLTMDQRRDVTAHFVTNAPHTHYVSLTGGHNWPFLSWEDAATNIHDAVAACASGDAVLVTNGTFAVGSQIELSSAITLTSVNGRDVTVIDGGGGTTRCVRLSHAGALVSGFAITGGYEDLGEGGGGVYIDEYGTVADCVISNNVSERHGGAAYLWLGGVLTNCAIVSNSATNNTDHWNDAGGVRCVSGGLLVDCTIRDNTSIRYGGGVKCSGSTTVRGCTIVSNSAGYGGGLEIGSGVEVIDCLIAGNSASGTIYGGGGVKCLAGGSIRRSTIVGNWSPSGAGVMCQNGGSVRNCLVARNFGNNGGGIYCYEGGLVQNCTVVGNTAVAQGGGVRTVRGGTFENTIVWSNTASSGPNRYNFDGGDTYAHVCLDPQQTGPGNIDDHPVFVDYSGEDYRLWPTSPCINTGSNQAWMASALDLDGNARTNGIAVDIGAYEFYGPPDGIETFVVTGQPAAHGTASTHDYGTHYLDSGTPVTNSVTSPADETGGVRWVCTGWSGVGSVPASGSSNVVTFTITNDSTLTWLWTNEYELVVSASAGGAVNSGAVAGWYTNGLTVTNITAMPDAGYGFAGWSGNVPSGNTNDNPLALTMDQARTATANFAITNSSIAGLVAYYPFNGNANDESGNGYHGAVTGATLTADAEGIADSAYAFDGVDDYIDLQQDLGLRLPCSFSCWLRPAPGGQVYTSDRWNSYNAMHNGIRIFCRTNVTVGFGGAGGQQNDRKYRTAAIVDTNQIYHIAVVAESEDTVRVYLDGEQHDVTMTERSYTGISYLGWPDQIGRNTSSGATQGNFGGTLDEIRIYDRALTSNEVWQLHLAEAPNTRQLVVSGSPMPHGTSSPYDYGTNQVLYGTAVTNTVPSPADEAGGVRYVCAGWTGDGDVPGSGDTNVVTFTIETNSTLTWLWETEYELTVGTSGSGTVSSVDGWYTNGASVEITASVTDTNYSFSH